MPYLQSWVDPNTGATFSQSYVRCISEQAQPQNSQVGIVVGRWASATCFSLGYNPLERRDITVGGVAYANNFGPQVAAAQGSFNAMLASTADTYIGSLTAMSGAVPVP